jgi:tRNA 2-thiouridine synthesizing protein A
VRTGTLRRRPDSRSGSRASRKPAPPPAARGPESGEAGAAERGAVAAPDAGQRPELSIDALGKKCPIPIIMLAERIREVPVGRLVEVLADDPAARTDLPAWCALKSHAFVTMTELPVGWSFMVRRSY